MKRLRQRVVIGIIQNKAGQYLIAKRAKGVHLENYWEFPGGKAKPHESFKTALRRELQEEIGIQVSKVRKLIEYDYEYEDRCIHFQVFKVFDFMSTISSREQQPLDWVDIRQLEVHDMPPANKAIIDALKLPALYMIADYAGTTADSFLNIIEKNLAAGIRLMQFRAHDLGEAEYVALAKKVYVLCEKYAASMICNCEQAWVNNFHTHGIHLSSPRLVEASKCATPKIYFSASCHTAAEVALANRLNIKCILIGPVHATQSHPNAVNIEWAGFSRLCRSANMPVYALGGVESSDHLSASAYGAQGIAGIRTFL